MGAPLAPVGPAPAEPERPPAKSGAGHRPTDTSVRRRLQGGVAVVALAAITGAQVISANAYYWPVSDLDQFYPQTPGISAAVAQTEDGRALLGGTFPGSTAAAYGMRTVTGHAFPAESWREMLLTLDPEAYKGATNPRVEFQLSDGSLNNPLYDRLAVNSVVTSPNYAIPGPWRDYEGQPRTADTLGGLPITVGGGTGTAPVPLAPQALRGFAVKIAEPAGDGTMASRCPRSSATVPASRGQGVLVRPLWEPLWVQIPVAGEDLADHPAR